MRRAAGSLPLFARATSDARTVTVLVWMPRIHRSNTGLVRVLREGSARIYLRRRLAARLSIPALTLSRTDRAQPSPDRT